MAKIPGGGPRARAVGYELRKKREQDRVTTRALAARLEIAKTRLLRYESGEILPSLEEIARYLGKLSVSRSETERILEQAREAHSAADDSTLSTYGRGIHQELATLAEFESTAANIVEVAPLVIPGLLQTREYANAVLDGQGEEEKENKLAVRLQRQEILNRSRPPQLTVIVGEFALREPIGGVEVLRAQLDQLISAAERERISVRVLESGSEVLHAGHLGEFMLFDYDDKARPLVHVEGYFTASSTSNAKVIATYQGAVDDLLNRALGRDESVQFIKALHNESGSLR
ncbi:MULTISPECIES: helix-turn-helix transcriptional regulator [unclassified Saccharopolyspora]|uniref:helix-turn-helix domain-containing protein n=1 Tax=Saccharopolyspora TaxID=1835 RepID=UPI00190BCBF2|nr:helix-turn-helix transcriptional regulator [Saccharopolyspora sp. HNM0986]MBK0865519.1 helix-turn-helix transcriptional regulator [Saccharopolyspora sp. HNM0986]